MHKFNHIRQMAPMFPYGRTRCRHLSNNIEPSFYGNDAPYVKLLRPLVIFGDSRTDSQALRAEYCIPHNTAIYFSTFWWALFLGLYLADTCTLSLIQRT